MSKGPDDSNLQIFSSAVNAQTGPEQPVSVDALIQLARSERPDEEEQREIRFWSSYLNTGQWGLMEGIDPDNLADTGWGVVFGVSTPPAVREALRPLLDWRREQARERYREFFGQDGVRPGESKNIWLRRQGTGPGQVTPERVPYYLLLVGSPEEIPFPFQYQLLQYAVGRLYFDTPEGYANYAASVVEAERTQLRLRRRAALFHPVYTENPASHMFATSVAGPLAKELQSVSAIKGWTGEPWAIQALLENQATHAQLVEFMRSEDSPALLFASAHGLVLPPGSPDQIPMQGALVSADWPGWESVSAGQAFSAADLPSDATLWGSIVVLPGSYTVGTPQLDESLPWDSDHLAQVSYRPSTDRMPSQVSYRPFIARLPMQMLSHPRGGALAVIGTTGRQWILPEDRRSVELYRDVLGQLMNSRPVGAAMSLCSGRYAESSMALSKMQQEIAYGVNANPAEYLALWQEVNNARGMLLLGDPAVRLPVQGDLPENEAAGARPALQLSGITTIAPPEFPAEAVTSQPSLEHAEASGQVKPVNVKDVDTGKTDAPGKDVITIAPLGEEATWVPKDTPPVLEVDLAPEAETREVVQAAEAEPRAPESRARRAAESPYVGPRSFRIGEAFFYGRDREAAALVGLIIAERIVLLYSPSGAGKSSLINARAVPDLVRQGYRVLQTIRVNLEPPRELAGLDSFNRYVYSALLSLEEGYPKPRRYPSQELAGMTLDAYLKRRGEEEAKEREERRAAGTLPLSDQDRERTLTVLVFDQFEEIITTNPIDRAGRQAFFNQAGAALRDKNRYGLFVMREDYIASIDPYLRPIPTRLSTRFRLDLLERAGAMEAIMFPARDVGVTFQEKAASKLVDDLCTINVQQPDGALEPVMGIYIEPVQLQVVCSKLWQDLPPEDTDISREDVENLGSTDVALADFYALMVQEVASKTSVRERMIRRWFDTRLITRQGIRGQVLLGASETEGLPNTALRQLEAFYLVRGEKRGGATWYELSHDRLIKPVRENNEAWFGEHLSHLQRQAETWEENDRPDALLMAGADLDEAERWAKENENEMELVEREFLAESVQAREEQHRREQDAARREADAKRIRNLARISTIFSILAVIAGIIAGYSIVSANRERRAAEARQAAQIAWGSYNSDPQQALVFALHSINLSGGVEKAPWRAIDAIRQALPSYRMVLTMRGTEGPIYSVAYSPDGTRIATGGADGILHVMDSASGQELFQVQVAARPEESAPAAGSPQQAGGLASVPQQAVHQVIYTPDGASIAVAGSSGVPALYDAGTGQFLASFGDPDHGAVRALSFSPDGSQLAAGYADGAVKVWATDSREPILEANTGPITSLAFDPQGTRLVIADDSGLEIMDVASGRIIMDMYRSIEELASRVIFSPDGEWYLTANADGSIWQNPINENEESFLFEGHLNPVSSIAYSPDGLSLVSTASDKTVRIWDAESHEEVLVLTGHTAPVNDAVFSPDGKRVASASDDGSVRVWDISPSGGSELWTMDQLDINSVTYSSADGGRLATSKWAEGITVWDANTLEALYTIPSNGFHFWQVRYNPDGSKLAAIFENSYRIWDARDGRQLLEMPEEQGFPSGLAWSTDGKRLATGNEAGLIRIWDAASGAEIRAIPVPPEIPYIGTGAESLAFHPTKNWLAAEYDQGGWVLWNLDTSEKILHVREGYERGVAGLAFAQSGDGSVYVLAAEAQGSLNQYRLQDDGTLELSATLPSQPGDDTAIAVRENQFVFSGQYDEIYQTDVESLAVIQKLYGHSGKISELAFREDGQTIYSASEDGTLRAHTLSWTVLVEEARRRIRTGLDDTQCQSYGLEKCP